MNFSKFNSVILIFVIGIFSAQKRHDFLIKKLNKAESVYLISYNLDLKKPAVPAPKLIGDSTKIKKEKNFIFALEYYKKPFELLEISNQKLLLKSSEIKSLKNALNFSTNEMTGIISKSGCYYPRNAILLVNKNQKITDIFEICFECHRLYQISSRSKMKELEISDDTLASLEDYFNSKGINTTFNKE